MAQLRIAFVCLVLFSHCAFGQKPAEYPSGMFSELPHARAKLRGGSAVVDFPVTSDDSQAAAFFRQGLTLLFAGASHEAARAFREVITRDPDCASGHLGLALATRHDHSRAKEFAWHAFQRRANAGATEQRLIDLYARYFESTTEPEMELVDAETGKRRAKATAPTAVRRNQLLRDLKAFPGITASVSFAPFLILEQSRAGEQPDAEAIELLLSRAGRHPAIRLAMRNHPDKFNADQMWRTPTAFPSVPTLWQSTASAFAAHGNHTAAVHAFAAARRADHHWMQAGGRLPYESEAYLASCKSLGRSLLKLGALSEAAELGSFMASLPRHPQRHADPIAAGESLLLEALTIAERWEQIVSWAAGVGDRGRDLTPEQLLAVGRAHLRLDQTTAAKDCLSELRTRGASGRRSSRQLAILIDLENGISSAVTQLRSAGLDPAEVAALLAAHAGSAVALPVARTLPDDDAVSLAVRTTIEREAGQREAAAATFQRLRTLTSRADLSAAPFRRIGQPGKTTDAGEGWQFPASDPTPGLVALNKIGPREWVPPQAPVFSLPQGKVDGPLGSAELQGRPVLLVFYLGFGCIHCVEQLNELTPRFGDFQEAGIEIIAIGSDSVDEVKASILQDLESGTETVPFRILCDPGGDVFKAYSCWDEFKQEPLHGTFLIDQACRVRWRDISEEPFMQTDFLLEECNRLLREEKEKVSGPFLRK